MSKHGRISLSRDSDLAASCSLEREGQNTTELDHTCPESARLATIIIAICLSQFCLALDNTIISTAIPQITNEFLSINDIGWYGNSYLFAECAVQILVGQFYAMISLKSVYLAALVIFEVGSVISGAALSSRMLILGRAVAGMGAAGLSPGAVLIISDATPLHKRAAYVGLTMAMYGIASGLGPLMGGLFTSKLTWRWCFYINLPIGGLAAIFIVAFYPAPQAKPIHGNWKANLVKQNVPGILVFTPMVLCLLLAFQWGGLTYPWKSARVLGLLLGVLGLMAVFSYLQNKQQNTAFIPMHILKRRAVITATLFSTCLCGAFFVTFYYLPIWFQAVKGYSAIESGIYSIPMIMSLSVTSILAGIAVTKLGYSNPFLIGSSIFTAIGAGLLSTLRPASGPRLWIMYQVVLGAGVGLGMQNCVIGIQASLPMEDVPIATSIVMFSQQLGGVLFIAVAQNIFSSQLDSGLRPIVADPIAIIHQGATSLEKLVPPQSLATVRVKYNNAISCTFILASAIAAMSLIGSALSRWHVLKQ